jgi:hypothetical protein
MREYLMCMASGVLGIFILSFVSRENPNRHEWGVTQSQLEIAHKDCELNIARNKSCKAVITWEVVDNAK